MSCALRPRLCIVTPALADANNGNWRTAARWQRMLRSVVEVVLLHEWQGEPAQALVALHARRSAASIERFHAVHPERGLAVVLTGTDVYHDIEVDMRAQHCLEYASHLVVLQPEAMRRLTADQQGRTGVLLQSARCLFRHDKARRTLDIAAVGHLREEKDPATLMRAVRRLPAPSRIRVLHAGGTLDAALAEAANATAAEVRRYRWLGALPAQAARRLIARSRALVHMSRMEGGAHVVIEALRSQVPVLASRIDGNIGLLGASYEGYFPVGDDAALAALMLRFEAQPGFAARLEAQCAARAAAFAPKAEAAAVRALVAELLAPVLTMPLGAPRHARLR